VGQLTRKETTQSECKVLNDINKSKRGLRYILTLREVARKASRAICDSMETVSWAKLKPM
jgi:hypothetical protein